MRVVRSGSWRGFWGRGEGGEYRLIAAGVVRSRFGVEEEGSSMGSLRFELDALLDEVEVDSRRRRRRICARFFSFAITAFVPGQRKRREGTPLAPATDQ